MCFDIDRADSAERPRSDQSLPSTYFRNLNPGEVQCHTRAGKDQVFGSPMGLHSAYPHRASSWLERERLPPTDAARKQSTRNHSAESLHHESAVNGEPGQMIGIAVIPTFCKPDESLPQFCYVLSRRCTHRKNL